VQFCKANAKLTHLLISPKVLSMAYRQATLIKITVNKWQGPMLG
jgi:hypothetical protein